jgi:tetratricopeptide (TPR) repeat protein
MSGEKTVSGDKSRDWRRGKISRLVSLSLGLLSAAGCLVLSPQQSSCYINSALDRGRQRMSHGDYDGAVNALGEALGMNDKDADAYLMRGECFYKLGNYKLAIQDLNNAIQYAPNNARAFLVRGSCHVSLGEDDSAIADYEGAIKLEPSLAQRFFRNGGDRAGAGMDNGGNTAGGGNAGNGNGVRRGRVVRRNGQTMIVEEQGSGAGLNLHAVNDYKQAMHRVYPHGLAGGSDAPAPNDGNATDRDDTQAIGTAPGNGNGGNGNGGNGNGGNGNGGNGSSGGNLNGGNGNQDDGQPRLRRRRQADDMASVSGTGGAVGGSLNPKQTDAQNNAGIEQDTGIKARKTRFVNTLDQDPNRGVFGVIPGAGEFQGNAKEALIDFNEVIRNNPTDPNKYYQRAKALQKLGRVDDALKDYNSAIELDPQKSQYYIGRASVFYQLGKPLLSEAEIVKARAVDPDVPGVVHFDLPKYPPSVKWSGGDGPGGH